MRVLALDISTKTGWCLLEGEPGQTPEINETGLIRVVVDDFNVNEKPGPNHNPKYPWNILTAANEMGRLISELILEMKPDLIVAENTVKGRNRHTQRILEWVHKAFLESSKLNAESKFFYMDPSEWRAILSVRLSNADKKNNREVSQGKKRGRVTKKHLSVRWANETYGLKLKIKDNDVADSIALATAALVKLQEK